MITHRLQTNSYKPKWYPAGLSRKVMRQVTKARGHFPSEAAALKCPYLVTRSLDPKGTGQQRWAARWKPALNAFAVTFADRMPDLNRG
jgi:putative transposase